MDLSTPWTTVFTVGVGALLFSVFYRHLILRYKLRHLPGPRGLPIIGNLLQYGPDSMAFMKTMDRWAAEFRETGHYLQYRGLLPLLTVFNARDLDTILRNSNLDNKSTWYELLIPWLRDGLLMSKGHKWTTRRKLLTPSFHFSILSKFLDVFNEQAQCLTEKLTTTATGGEAINVAPIVALCSLDVICETIMGFKLQAQTGRGREYVEAVHRLGYIALQRVQNPLYWNEFLFKLTKLGRENNKYIDYVHKFTKQVIRDRKQEVSKSDENDVTIDDGSRDVRHRRRLAFLDLLIEVQRRDDTFTDEGIQEEVDTFMFEGHDTVSSSITFALYLIGRHPHVQEKIADELQRVFGNDNSKHVTTDDLQKLEYLGRVMKESQRMLTTVPIIGRRVEKEFRLGGTIIPKGVEIDLDILRLHRDPNQFPNPDKFDPDRFLPSVSDERNIFAFLPFSAGNRNCIGQKFAIMEQKVILATLLRRLRVTSLQTTEELGLKTEMILRSDNGVMIKFEMK